MAEKAKLMGDKNIMEQILNVKPETGGGKKCKMLGRQIKPWDQKKWDENNAKIYFDGNYYKYTQNKQLQTKLLLYDKRKIFVKADGKDKIWAIGLDISDEKIKDKSNWNGTNLSGKGITNVRDQLIKQQTFK
eukprot:62479_1